MVSMSQMSAMLSSATMLKTAKEISSNRNLIEGQKNVLSMDIKSSQRRGIDTANREKRLEFLENSSANLMNRIGNIAADVTEKIAGGYERIGKEEAESEKAAEGNVDTLDISENARSATGTFSPAAFAPPAPILAPATTGKVVDVKA